MDLLNRRDVLFFICCQYKQVFSPWRIVIRELAAIKLSDLAVLYAISSSLVFFVL